LTPQRYNFLSKSQRNTAGRGYKGCCNWHHKDTTF